MPDREDDTYLIDPPVGPFSSLEDLRRWRQELRQMPDSDAREEALRQIDDWISLQETQKR